MNTLIDDSTMLVTLTVKDLKRIVAETTAAQMQEIMKANAQPQSQAEPRWVRGLDGLANAMGVSKYVVCEWKQKGLLDGMYMQVGKVINFDLATIRQKLGRNLQSKKRMSI